MDSELANYLHAYGIREEIAEASGVKWCTSVDDLPSGMRGRAEVHHLYLPGVLFPWTSVNGSEPEYQYRPIVNGWNEKEPGQKYDQLAGRRLPLYVHPSRRERVLDSAAPLVIVEGTKQSLAGVSWTPEGFGIVGIFGCYGWQSENISHPDWNYIPLPGRVITVIFDADVSTNRNVWDAADRLSLFLRSRRAEVQWVRLPVGSSAGLDDFLASIPVEEREATMSVVLWEMAEKKLPRAPAKKAQDTPRAVAEESAEETYADVPDESLGALLEDLEKLVTRFVRFPDESFCTATVLWIMHTHLLRQAEWTPRLLITSAVRSSGKSVLMEILHALCYRAEYVLSASVSATFRSVGSQPTVLWDEADNANLSAPDRSDLIALFNAGARLGGPKVKRTNPVSMTVEYFDVYFPLAMAGISKEALPDPLISRSILLPMEKATATERARLEKLRWKFVADSFASLERRLKAWSARHGSEVPTDFSGFPEGLEARTEDLWEPLLAIASSAGWLERGLRALESDVARHEESDQPDLLRLLDAIRRIYEVRLEDETVEHPDWIFTTDLLDRLAEDDEAPTVQNGKALASLLGRALGIHTYKFRIGGRQAHGYKRDSFSRAWLRYGIVTTESDEESQSSDLSHSEPGMSQNPSHPSHPSQTDPEKARSEPDGTDGTDGTDNQKGTALSVGAVAFDLETASADQIFTWSGQTQFIRIASVVIDDAPAGIVALPELLEILEAAETIYGHNVLAYDLVVLAQHAGANYRALAAKSIDSLIMVRLEDPLPGGVSYVKTRDRRNDAGYLASHLLGIPDGKATLARLKHQYGSYHDIPTENLEYRHYARTDAEIAWKLGHHAFRFGSGLEMSSYAEREHELATLAGEMSLRGVAVDLALLARRLQEHADRLGAVREELGALGVPLRTKDGQRASQRPWSTQYGKERIVELLEERGISLPTTSRGNPSLTTEALDGYRGEPLVDLLLSALAERTIPQQIQDALAPDGRVHPSISLGQASGRWSFRNPGLTGLGKRSPTLRQDRELIVPRAGYVLLSADLSQIDARAVAAHSQDEKYLGIFQSGEDLHRRVAREILGDSGDEAREVAKRLNHSTNYGIGPERFSSIATRFGTPMTVEEARELLAAYRSTYPDLAIWQHAVREKAKHGDLLLNGFGRFLRCDPERAYTQAPALVAQSAARDIICEGMLRLPREIQEMLVLLVHDEIVLEVPAESVAVVAPAVVEALSFHWIPEDLHGSTVPVICDTPKVGTDFKELRVWS